MPGQADRRDAGCNDPVNAGEHGVVRLLQKEWGKGTIMITVLRLALVCMMTAVLGGCGYNTIQALDEQSSAAWSEVLNQYQRRADLIPNLVSTVKGYATHESEVLQQVTAARARVGSVQVTPDLLKSPDGLKGFQSAQGELSSALGRLMVVAENYPQLKADAAFRDLQAQLEGTENRITVARNRYIRAVQDYNVAVRSFPNNLTAMTLGYATKPNFTVENEKTLAVPPKVDFGNGRQAVPGSSR